MLAPCTELIRRRHPTDEERASLTGQLLREPQPAQIAALVERGADPDDRRRSVLRMTDPGRAEVMGHLMPMLRALHAIDSDLDEHERAVVAARPHEVAHEAHAREERHAAEDEDDHRVHDALDRRELGRRVARVAHDLGVVADVHDEPDRPLRVAQRRAAQQQVDVVERDKGIDVFAVEFNSSSVDFKVRWWAGSTPRNMWESKDKVIRAIKRALDDAGIEIPFPYITHTFKEPVPLARNADNDAEAPSTGD